MDYIIDQLWLQQKVVIVLLLFSLLVGVVRYKKLFQPDRLFAWLVLIELAVELGSIYIGFIIKIQNFFIYNLLFIIIYPAFLLYYKKIGVNFPFYTLLTFFLSGALYSLFFESFNGGMYFIAPLFGAVTIVICIFYYFSFLLKSRQLENLFENSSFLFSCGLMIFYLGMIPFFLLSKYLLELPQNYGQYIIIILNFILYTFITLAFLCSHRNTY